MKTILLNTGSNSFNAVVFEIIASDISCLAQALRSAGGGGETTFSVEVHMRNGKTFEGVVTEANWKCFTREYSNWRATQVENMVNGTMTEAVVYEMREHARKSVEAASEALEQTMADQLSKLTQITTQVVQELSEVYMRSSQESGNAINKSLSTLNETIKRTAGTVESLDSTSKTLVKLGNSLDAVIGE